MPNPDSGLHPQPSLEGAVVSSRRPRGFEAALMAVLIITAALPYANTLRNSFVYDDTTQVLYNPYIQDFRHLREIFTTTVWSFLGDYRGVTNYYRPLMTLGYLVCYQLFGARAWGFHLANLLFNVGVVSLLYLVTRRMLRATGPAFLAAALFALHPIHTEPVDWIAGATDLELTFFYLLTFWFYLGLSRPAGGRSVARHAGIGVSFVAAMLSKEQALTLPFLAMVYEHFYRSDRTETTWARKLARHGALWLLALTYLVARMRLLGGFAPSVQRTRLDVEAVLLSGLALVGQYLWKLLWPARLCVYYVFPEDISVLLPWMGIGCGVLILSALLFAALWRGERIASFGLAWLLVTLAPVLNVQWMADNVFAERYLYLPSLGFCWMAGWGVVKLWSTPSTLKAIRRGAVVAATCILVPLSVFRIVTRNRDWRDDITLYKITLAASPNAYNIQNNLGVVYWNQGDLKAAEQEWSAALKLTPADPLILHNMGLISKRQKRYEEATSFFLRALQSRPNYSEARLDLGLTYKEMGLPQEAESHLRAAVALAPLNVRARNSLGELYFDEGRYAEAEEQFHRSLESQPTREGYWDLGIVYWTRKDPNRAESALKRAAALDPRGARVHVMLGLFYGDMGRTSEAVREYQAALQIDPTNPQALAGLKKWTSQPLHNKTSKP